MFLGPFLCSNPAFITLPLCFPIPTIRESQNPHNQLPGSTLVFISGVLRACFGRPKSCLQFRIEHAHCSLFICIPPSCSSAAPGNSPNASRLTPLWRGRRSDFLSRVRSIHRYGSEGGPMHSISICPLAALLQIIEVERSGQRTWEESESTRMRQGCAKPALPKKRIKSGSEG